MLLENPSMRPAPIVAAIVVVIGGAVGCGNESDDQAERSSPTPAELRQLYFEQMADQGIQRDAAICLETELNKDDFVYRGLGSNVKRLSKSPVVRRRLARLHARAARNCSKGDTALEAAIRGVLGLPPI